MISISTSGSNSSTWVNGKRIVSKGGLDSTIMVNGQSININDQKYNNVARITIEYVDQDKENDEQLVKAENLIIQVEGDCQSVDTNAGNVEVFGSITTKCRTYNGDVTVGSNIEGDCRTYNGDINASTIISETIKTRNGKIRKNRKKGLKKLDRLGIKKRNRRRKKSCSFKFW